MYSSLLAAAAATSASVLAGVELWGLVEVDAAGFDGVDFDGVDFDCVDFEGVDLDGVFKFLTSFFTSFRGDFAEEEVYEKYRRKVSFKSNHIWNIMHHVVNMPILFKD